MTGQTKLTVVIFICLAILCWPASVAIEARGVCPEIVFFYWGVLFTVYQWWKEDRARNEERARRQGSAGKKKERARRTAPMPRQPRRSKRRQAVEITDVRLAHRQRQVHCPVCSTELEAHDAVHCKRCLTVHHRECFDYCGECATFACGMDRYNPGFPSEAAFSRRFVGKETNRRPHRPSYSPFGISSVAHDDDDDRGGRTSGWSSTSGRDGFEQHMLETIGRVLLNVALECCSYCWHRLDTTSTRARRQLSWALSVAIVLLPFLMLVLLTDSPLSWLIATVGSEIAALTVKLRFADC